ncbi:MAG: SDR family oxidoreductase [Acidobacteriota bacterium]
MRILLTGGAGYVGSVLAPLLVSEGHDVTILDAFRRGPQGVLPVLASPASRRVALVRGDVRDPSHRPLFASHDAIVHLAALVGYPACDADPVEAQSLNVEGTRHLVSCLGDGQVLLLASTGSSYGKVEGLCTEDHPINPLTLYGRTKAEAESIVLGRGRSIVLRLATLFGVSPAHRNDLLVNDMVRRAVADRSIVLYEGWAQRSLLHVRDCARAMALALARSDIMAGRIFNVGDESLNLTKRQIVATITEKAPARVIEADYQQDPEKRDYPVSFERIRSVGFRSEVGLPEGIDELCKLYAVLPRV